jgi:hypothetical protein
MSLRDLPLDLLQDISAALARYVRARRRQKLLQEQARLQEELQDLTTDLAEIQALATKPRKEMSTTLPETEGGENHV